MEKCKADALLNVIESDTSFFTKSELSHKHTALYRTLINAMPGFKVRSEQDTIIRACGDAIRTQGIAAIQADTGVGKTLGYLLAALPFITDKGKRLVVSTHTVALQTQLIEKDIPTVKALLTQDIKVEIAKGASRYYCPKRAKDLLKKTLKIEVNKQQNLLDEGIEVDELQVNACDEQILLVQNLYDTFKNKLFSGDLDTYEQKGLAQIQEMINRQSDRCPKVKNCEFGDVCPYFLQREAIEQADIVVANHSLTSIAADNNHTVLGSLEGSIIVFDEAHHIHNVYRNHLQASFEPNAMREVRTKADNLPKLLSSLEKVPDLLEETSNKNLKRALNSLCRSMDENQMIVSDLDSYLVNNFSVLRGEVSQYETEEQWLLSLQPTEPSFSEQVRMTLQALSSIQTQIRSLSKISDNSNFLGKDKPKPSQEVLRLIGEWSRILMKLNEYFDSGVECLERYVEFDEYITHDQRINCGLVRWVVRDENKREFNYRLISNVVSIREHFQERILKNAESVMFTSATLKIQSQFNHFIEPLGLSGTDKPLTTCDVQTPFSYQAACLTTPVYHGDPNSPHHAETVCKYLKQSINRHKAILVLFTSYRQLNEAYTLCSKQLKSQILCQSEYSKRELISRHRHRIEKGATSILFGVDGLSEGLDLQKHYLTCVIITKLPFPALNAPMFKHEREMIEASGRMSFFEQSLPICERKLIQSVGRLIRSEDDYGEVLLLDPRVNTKQYGRNLLTSLPMVQRNQNAI